MELLDRFTPLMSRALHYAGNALTVPLPDILADLCTLIDAERNTAHHAATDQLDNPGHHEALHQCRFAVYAWVDEILLNAPRPDASAWMGMSLQSRYFDTSTAGYEVFKKLRAQLDAQLDAQRLPSDDKTLPQLSTLPLSGNADTSAQDENYDGLKLAADLKQVADLPLLATDREVLRVYAECLLYGFCGRYFPCPEVLQKLRQASCYFLQATEPLLANNEAGPPPPSPLHWLEPVLYVAVPLCATFVFALYCADILANLPLKVFLL